MIKRAWRKAYRSGAIRTEPADRSRHSLADALFAWAATAYPVLSFRPFGHRPALTGDLFSRMDKPQRSGSSFLAYQLNLPRCGSQYKERLAAAWRFFQGFARAALRNIFSTSCPVDLATVQVTEPDSAWSSRSIGYDLAVRPHRKIASWA